MNDCCVIIPIYNIKPTDNEILSIKRTVSVLLSDYDVYYVCSKKLELDNYREIADLKVITFDEKFFKSNKTYSRLLLSEMFYNAFMSYKYMLIAQTDTYIVDTNYRLSYFLEMNYDYIGAQWAKGPFFKPYTTKDRIKLLFVHNPSEIHVGNGGFSLRNVKKSRELVRMKKYYIAFLWRFNEDLFFSNEAYKCLSRDVNAKPSKYYTISYMPAPEHISKQFALETNMKEEIDKGNIPFAVHAFEKYYPDVINNI